MSSVLSTEADQDIKLWQIHRQTDGHKQRRSDTWMSVCLWTLLINLVWVEWCHWKPFGKEITHLLYRTVRIAGFQCANSSFLKKFEFASKWSYGVSFFTCRAHRYWKPYYMLEVCDKGLCVWLCNFIIFRLSMITTLRWALGWAAPARLPVCVDKPCPILGPAKPSSL